MLIFFFPHVISMSCKQASEKILELKIVHSLSEAFWYVTGPKREHEETLVSLLQPGGDLTTSCSN